MAPVGFGLGVGGHASPGRGISAECGRQREGVRVEVPAASTRRAACSLVLSDVRLPRMVAVVLRAGWWKAPRTPTNCRWARSACIAESKDAEGVAEHDVVRIEVTKKLKRWRQEHPDIRHCVSAWFLMPARIRFPNSTGQWLPRVCRCRVVSVRRGSALAQSRRLRPFPACHRASRERIHPSSPPGSRSWCVPRHRASDTPAPR